MEWKTPHHGTYTPLLIYGTAWKAQRTKDLVTQAVLAGFRGIDTACQPRHYHEQGVGDALLWLAEKHGIQRESLYLQTKFTPPDGQDIHSIPYDPKAPLRLQLLQSLKTSLLNLQTPYLDALILHSPLASLEETLEAWNTLEEFHSAGIVKQLGISNCYSPDLFQKIYSHATVKPAILQNRFYPSTRYDHTLRQWCRQRDIIYQSFWTLTANPDLLVHPVLTDLAKSYSLSTAQILFRLLTLTGVAPLTGTTSMHHMRQDLDIFSIHLNESEIESFRQLVG